MRDLLHNPNFMTLVGTLFGGAGVKFLEQWLGRAKDKSDQGAQIRVELRQEIDSLRAQLIAASAEETRLETVIEDWRSKYYDLRDEQTKVVTELTLTLEKIKTLEARLSERVANSTSK